MCTCTTTDYTNIQSYIMYVSIHSVPTCVTRPISCCPAAVRTVFNLAPGEVGLGQEFFEATDILCLNESEVS